MNPDESKSNWHEKKVKLKRKFESLTDKDLIFEDSNKEEMLSRLQIKLGKTKEELQIIIARL